MSSLKTLAALSKAQTDFPANVPDSVVTEFVELSEAANDARQEKKTEKNTLKQAKANHSDTKKEIGNNNTERKENKAKIRETKSELRSYKNRFGVGDRKDRKSLKSQIFHLSKRKEFLKKRSKDLKQQAKNQKKTITGCRTKIKALKDKIKTAKQKFEEATNTINQQIKTLQVLKRIKSLLKTVDLNNPKYAEMISFYNSNKDRKISLDPSQVTLDSPTPNLQTLILTERHEQKKVEKAKQKRTITGVNKSQAFLKGSKVALINAIKFVGDKFRELSSKFRTEPLLPERKPLPAGPSHNEER